MKSKIKHYIKEIIVFFIVMGVAANLISLYKSSDLNKEVLMEANMTLLGDVQYRFPSDKPILIHFWASWCPTCKLESSNIQRISQSYEVLSIAEKSGSDNELREYMKERNINYNVVNDESGFFAREFNVKAYPTTFIYDKDRNLVFSEVGYTSTLGLWLRMWWAGF